MSISFKDIKRIDILRFENIRKMYDNDFKRVVFDLSIEFEFFKAKTRLDGEESDFLKMKECLEKLYTGKLKTFVINPIGEQFRIQFDLKERRQIKIGVKLFNPMFTGKFEFEFITDQTYIPELIRQIETTMI